MDSGGKIYYILIIHNECISRDIDVDASIKTTCVIEL